MEPASAAVVPGTLDGRPALAIHSPPEASEARNFVLLTWRGERLTLIRDFHYVPYITDEVARGCAAFVPDDGP